MHVCFVDLCHFFKLYRMCAVALTCQVMIFHAMLLLFYALQCSCHSNRNGEDHHQANYISRTNSQNNYYDYDAYGSHNMMHPHQRYYAAHGTPPPAYSDGSSPSSNSYSTPRSNSGISTPRGISSNYNNLAVNNNIMTNGVGSRPSQPPPAPPPVFVG